MPREPSPYAWAWWGSLASLALAALTGAFLRFGMAYGFPAGVSFINVRHAHSHLMYFGWVTPALMALVASRLPRREGASGPRSFNIVIGLTLVLGLLSYPAFFLWGYGPVQVGQARLPVAVIFSSLNILAWYAYVALYFRRTRGLPRDLPMRLWDAALVFLVLASFGAWGRAALVALHVENVFLESAAVHLFLDLFSDGWFLLALLGLAFAVRPLPGDISPWPLRLLWVGLPLTFLLGVPVSLVPPALRAVSGLGGLLAAAGVLLYLRQLRHQRRLRRGDGWSPAWALPLALLAVKALMQAGASLTPLALWGERLGLRVFYLHVFLLGSVTLALFAAAGDVWGEGFASGRRPLSIAILLLLASLLPLTGLWPSALAGPWAVRAAAWIALLPAAVVLALLARRLFFSRKQQNRTQMTQFGADVR